MRGKVLEREQEKNHDRITPAYAGKSRKWTGSQLHTWDHPRLCGEKGKGGLLCSTKRGSPPPMRGKEEGMKIRVDLDRITPAYAGKRIKGKKFEYPI